LDYSLRVLESINGLIHVLTRDRLIFKMSVAIREAADLRIMFFRRDMVLSRQFNELLKIDVHSSLRNSRKAGAATGGQPELTKGLTPQ
jgi:hypothetical protein